MRCPEAAQRRFELLGGTRITTARLAGRVALVTGAGSGLGEATALRFAEEGAHAIATDVNDHAVTRVAEAINDTGGKATSRQQDVVDEARWATLMSDVVESHGGLDVLVNNAGISWQATVEQTSSDDWKKVIDVNLTSISSTLCIRATSSHP